MRNYRILTAFQLKNMLYSMNPFDSIGKKGKARYRGILVCLLLIMAVGSVVFLEFEMNQVLSTIRQQAILPGLALMICMMSTLVLGLFQCLSELYQGRDAVFLSVLPLSSRQILTARLATLYVSELAINAVLLMPATVLYALSTDEAVTVILRGLLVVLFSPAIPLAVVSLISYFLMRISGFAKHRETITMALSLVLAIAWSVFVTLNNSSNDEQMSSLVMLLLKENGLLQMLTSRIPPVRWGAEGICGNVPLCLLFVGVSCLAMLLPIFVCGPGYLEQALSLTEQTMTTKSRKIRQTDWKESSRFMAQYMLEWRMILRTPAWMMNSLMGVIMFPLMIGIGVIAGVSNNAGPEMMTQLQEITRNADQGWVLLIGIAVICMGCMVNPAVATAYSREGGRFSAALTWPILERTRMHAKLAMGLSVNLLCGFMIACVNFFTVRAPLLTVAGAFVMAQLIGLATSAFSLLIDMCYPRLSYINEMQAIKQNMHVGLSMAIWLVCVILAGVPVIWTWNLGGMAAAGITCGVIVLESAVSMVLLERAAAKPRYLPD